MNFAKPDSCNKLSSRMIRDSILGPRGFLLLALSLLPWCVPTLAQSQQRPNVPEAQSGRPDRPATAGAPVGAQVPEQQASGSISGTILDQTGGAVVGARVTLTPGSRSPSQEAVSGDDGQFSFSNVAPGPFRLTVTAAGFATETSSGVLQSGESTIVPQIVLTVSAAATQVQVQGLSQVELAEVQIKAEEMQRVFGFIPNFYVSYVPDAAPLTSKQKFQLASRTIIDPVSFGLTGAVAGIEQGLNMYSGYGGGAQGYGKRYGAAYANLITSTFLGDAIFPSLLKQDPRYFYKGTGSTRSRLLYAISNSVMCKGDNGRWQVNYSYLLGDFAASGISNLYYPATDRNGAALTFENALIGIGATAAADVLQEFVIRKLTSHVPGHDPGKS